MSDVESLLTRARALAAKHQRELTTVSKWLFGDWRRLGEIEAGASFLRPPTLKAALERMTALETNGPPRKASSKGGRDGQANERPTGRVEEAGARQGSRGG
jgi:hypothetical protein